MILEYALSGRPEKQWRWGARKDMVRVVQVVRPSGLLPPPWSCPVHPVARACFLLFAAVGLIASGRGVAQVPDPGQLDGRVRLIERVVIGGPSDSTLAGPADVDRTSGGHIVVLSGGVPRIYDSTGKVMRDLARIGDGPRELREPGAIEVGFDDSLRVFSNSRLSVFTPDLAASRVVVHRSAEVLEEYDATMLTATTYATRSRMHRVGPDWRSFNPVYIRNLEDGSVRRLEWRTDGDPPQRTITRASADQFWMTEHEGYNARGYRVVLADTTGNRTQSFVREPAWWVPRDPEASPTGPRGFGSGVMAIRQDEKGRLIVMALTPREGLTTSDYERALRREHGGSSLLILFSTVIEVIDPATGQVAVSEPLREHGVAIADGRHIATYREDAVGFPYLTLWELDIN